MTPASADILIGRLLIYWIESMHSISWNYL